MRSRPSCAQTEIGCSPIDDVAAGDIERESAMGLIGDLTGVDDVESQSRRPLIGFLADEELTQGRFNVFLVVFGPLLFVGGLVAGQWWYAAVGGLLIAWALLCYRWYRTRLVAASRALGSNRELEPRQDPASRGPKRSRRTRSRGRRR